jgi:hypothetical protein
LYDESSDRDARAGEPPLDDWARRIDSIIPATCPFAWVRWWAQPGWSLPSTALLPEPTHVEIVGDLRPMMGWVAPPHCLATAVVADGTAFPVDQGAPGGPSGSAPVRVVCLLDRWGRVAGRIHLDGRPPHLEPPSGGRLLDSMHRIFGLPTPPPAAPSSVLVDRIWLGAVADASREGAVALGWEQVLRLHPAVAVLAGHGLEMTDALVGDAVRLAPGAWSWEWLRQQCAESRWGDHLVSPELADWMDEGMFSRWVLDETCAPAELLTGLAPYLSPTALRRLRALVDR